jgi:hypothetical protein
MNYRHGEWLAHCDVCQRRYYASELRKRWDNLMVCKEDFETRHPQDFVRSTGPDPKPLPWTRPDSDGIEATLPVNCNCHYVMEIPYLIGADINIYKGHTLTPFGEVIIEDGATVIVHCEWIIE